MSEQKCRKEADVITLVSICCASVPRSFTVNHDVSFRNDGTPQLSVEFTVSVTHV